MSRRAIWKGVVAFGKVRVPVKLYSAVESKIITFHRLHDEDKVRLRQQMVCEVEDEPVDDDEIVKGLEVGEHEYVLVEPEDLDELQPETNRTIEVLGFVRPEEVDPRFYDRPYHLGPDGSEKKYAALVEALAKTGRVAICRWSFRNRFYNGAIRSGQGFLEVVTLRLAEEIAATKNLDLPQAEIAEKERKTARYLIDEMTEDFDPSQYRDDFRDALRDLVETKAKGGEIKLREAPEPAATEPEDLASVLQASVDEIRKKKKSRGGGR
jgi:DNA end-binding protein Ku